MVISRSTVFTKAVVRAVDVQANGLIRIQGENIVVDFGGMTIIGAPDEDRPNEYKGFGIVVENAKNVEIRNLVIQRFKVGILAKNVSGLTIKDCDVSDNWRMHLFSTPERENEVDWLNPRQNDGEEWLTRYGAGIYVIASDGAHLTGNRARNGQNGIVLSRTNGAVVADNDMSFMSGWGIALWRSSKNDVSNNRFDWCVRGSSWKVYQRGQDSAGILVFEQSSGNIFAYNSATHGGDGFFLYAGDETVERSGDGGSNDNIVYRNDFSHAAANGIEATFSTGNRFIENIVEECENGIWAGYSANTLILGNTIARNTTGVAIECGRDNVIESNTFRENATALALRRNAESPFAAKAFGKKRPLVSENYVVSRNAFGGDACAVSIGDTRKSAITANAFEKVGVFLRVNGSTDARVEGNNVEAKAIDIKAADFNVGPNFWKGPAFGDKLAAAVEIGGPVTKVEIPKTAGSKNAFLPEGTPRGRRFIFIDAWGPYDFSKVRLVPQRQAAWNRAVFHLLGPEAPFEIAECPPGITIKTDAAKMPAVIEVSSADGKTKDFAFVVKSPAAAGPVRADGVLLLAEWTIRYYAINEDPSASEESFAKATGVPPIAERKAPTIEFDAGQDAALPGLPKDRFAIIGECMITLDEGNYDVRAIADDGVRVWIDDRIVVDDWAAHPPRETGSRVSLKAGVHKIQLRYFELGGRAQLQFSLTPLR